MIRISCQNPSGWPNLRPRGVLEKNENGKSMSGFGRRMDLVFARPFCNIAQGATFVFAFASGSQACKGGASHAATPLEEPRPMKETTDGW